MKNSVFVASYNKSGLIDTGSHMEIGTSSSAETSNPVNQAGFDLQGPKRYFSVNFAGVKMVFLYRFLVLVII